MSIFFKIQFFIFGQKYIKEYIFDVKKVKLALKIEEISRAASLQVATTSGIDFTFPFILSSLLHSHIVDIFGALFILRIQYESIQTQCEEGARDVNNI